LVHPWGKMNKTSWFEVAESLVRAGYEILRSSGIKLTRHGSRDSQVVAACLVARSLSNMRAALLLMKASHIVEARTLVRCCFENSFYVAALSVQGQSFVDQMVDDEVRARQASAQFLFRDGQSREALAPETEQRIQAWLRESRKQSQNPASLNPQEIAKSTSISAAYNFYRELSGDSAHPSLRSLSRYLTSNLQGLEELDVDPRVTDEDAIDTLDLACVALLGVCLGACEIFDGQKQPAALEVAWQRMQALRSE
jgi:uncharacterized protein with von Willebrand factor type A (vWA) domain